MGQIPKVSVLMPVYNGEKYLKEAIESILTQSFADFELIIIDDGSTDGSVAIAKLFKDPRVRLYTQANMGLAATLNRSIGLARGEYLARQDADDVSLPRRLERQVEFLDAHPDCGVVGTWAEIWYEAEKTERTHRHPSDNLTLKFNLFFDSFFVHSSVMLRRKVFDEVGLYATEKSRQPEDYELWSRVLRAGAFEVANMPEALVIYREVRGSICRTGENPFVDRVVNMSAENLAWASGRKASDPVVVDIAALTHGATHRLSARPDFPAMLAVLRYVADRINPDSGEVNPSLKRLVRSRYMRIRLKYLKYLLSSLVKNTLKHFPGSKV